MAPPMHTPDAIPFLLLLLAPAGDKTPPTSSIAKPLDQATSALPVDSVESCSPPTCSKSPGDFPAHPAVVHPVIPTSEGTRSTPPTNSAVDRAIVNWASSAPPLVSTDDEPSSSLLFVPKSTGNQACAPPMLHTGPEASSAPPTSSTAKPVDHASLPPTTSPSLPSVEDFHPPPHSISAGTKAIFASPTHLPHPISDPQVLSYFTTSTSPILPPGTDQSTLFFAAEILDRKNYHCMSSYVKVTSPTLQSNSPSLTIFAMKDKEFPSVLLSARSIQFHIIPEYLSPINLMSLPHHHLIQTSRNESLMVTSNFSFLPKGMTSINMIEVNCSPLYTDGFIVLCEGYRPLDPALYVLHQLPPMSARFS